MLKAALHGLGRWGTRLTDSVKASSKLRIVKGVSRDPSRHGEYAAKYAVSVVASYEEVLRDAQIDAVVLATPHSQHHAQIIAAARAGKHVFVEKPLTLTRAHAEEAVEACRRAGVTMGIGFNRRHAPAFVELRRRLHAGDIGEVLHVEANFSGPSSYQLKPGMWRALRAESPAGGMTPRGVHTLDAMIQVAGPVSEVYAHSSRRQLGADIEVDDTTAMLFRFGSGATGQLTTITVTGELWRVHVFGSKGWLEMRGDNELNVMGNDGKGERLNLPAVDKEQLTLEAFADAVAAGQPCAVPVAEAVNGVAALEAIIASAASGKPVAVR